jgi:DNA-binding IclR family transcriptional regulator
VVGVGILQALTKADSALSLTAVAKASGVPSSSCHRYLTSFIKAGYVSQDPISGRYDLGPGIIQAGLAALRRADPVVAGLAACERLARSTERTAQLAIWTDDGPVIVSWRMGRIPVPTNLSVGARLPVLNSATGRAFFAYLPKVRWEGIVAKEGGTIEQAEAIAEQVRRDGYASVFGDVIPGLSAAAAPLLGARGEPAAVIAILALDKQLEDRHVAELVAEVRSTSSGLGAAPDHII